MDSGVIAGATVGSVAGVTVAAVAVSNLPALAAFFAPVLIYFGWKQRQTKKSIAAAIDRSKHRLKF